MERISEILNEITADTVLFFDMDETLIDTNIANFLSYKKAIQTFIQADLDLEYNPEQRFNRGVLKKTIPNLSDEIYHNIIQEKERLYQDYLPEMKLNKNVADILLKYSTINKTVLVTNCRKDRALLTLNHFELTDKFNSIFFRNINDNETKENKFKNAITSLDISPDSIIVFENEKEEIADAIEAGIKKENIHNIKT
jgi:beta-phosphoglucomutase